MPRFPILLALLLTALLLPLAVSARRLSTARQRLGVAEASLADTVGDGRRVLDLRQRQQRVAETKRPSQDLIARVNATLAKAGIPQTRFASHQPRPDAALPAAAPDAPIYRRQQVQINLRQMAMAELGAFLKAWSASQELWTPTRIELSRMRGPNNIPQFNVMLVLTATYVASE